MTIPVQSRWLSTQSNGVETTVTRQSAVQIFRCLYSGAQRGRSAAAATTRPRAAGRADERVVCGYSIKKKKAVNFIRLTSNHLKLLHMDPLNSTASKYPENPNAVASEFQTITLRCFFYLSTNANRYKQKILRHLLHSCKIHRPAEQAKTRIWQDTPLSGSSKLNVPRGQKHGRERTACCM